MDRAGVGVAAGRNLDVEAEDDAGFFDEVDAGFCAVTAKQHSKSVGGLR